MVNRYFLAKMHRAGQSDAPVPEGSMPAQQADPFRYDGVTSENPRLEHNQLSHAKLMPWFIEPFISDVPVGIAMR